MTGSITTVMMNIYNSTWLYWIKIISHVLDSLSILYLESRLERSSHFRLAVLVQWISKQTFSVVEFCVSRVRRKGYHAYDFTVDLPNLILGIIVLIPDQNAQSDCSALENSCKLL